MKKAHKFVIRDGVAELVGNPNNGDLAEKVQMQGLLFLAPPATGDFRISTMCRLITHESNQFIFFNFN